MDWMPDSMIADQLAALVPRMQPYPKGNIFWRSFGTRVSQGQAGARLGQNIPHAPTTPQLLPARLTLTPSPHFSPASLRLTLLLPP